MPLAMNEQISQAESLFNYLDIFLWEFFKKNYTTKYVFPDIAVLFHSDI